MEDGADYLCTICVNGTPEGYNVGRWFDKTNTFHFRNGSYSDTQLHKKEDYKGKGNAYHVGNHKRLPFLK